MSNENEKDEHITFAKEASLVLIGYPSESPITMDDLHARLPELDLPDGLQVVLQDMLDRGETVYSNLILLPFEKLSEFIPEHGSKTEHIQYTLAFGEHSDNPATIQIVEDIESNGYTNFLCLMDVR